ncbi:MAG TPA: hypothetical protein VGQ08_02565 [Nitrospiraceae bacterium]|jgi:hypothetical protein|nr:hypothetical protein [Nitrospiraceae bacterium]
MDDLRQIQVSFDTALVGYLKLSDSLTGELNYLFEHHEDDQNQYWRRTFVRASWSLVDGYIYALREICRVLAPLRADVIGRPDRDLLINDHQEIGDKIKSVLKLAVKIFDLSVPLNFGGSAWVAVRDSIEKRHNVVHPTSAATIFIAYDEWKKQKEAISWFISTFNSLDVAVQNKYSRR